MVALAQCEREVTSVRVKENAISRLITDGKINGTAEILGLDKDPNKKGHFIRNETELETLERVFRLYLEHSSKEKVLQAAKKFGITGKRGAPLSSHMLDIIFNNVRWRYRGLWRVNEDNKDVDDSTLPEFKRYQLVKLPHGPLLDEELLNQVQAKIDDTKAKRKKSGKDGYIYLLSRILYYEDGTPFTGESAKSGEYRYYYNGKHKIRLMCNEIDKLILSRIKEYLTNEDEFERLIAEAVKRGQDQLQKADDEIHELKAKLSKAIAAEGDLKNDLLDPEKRRSDKFMQWLENEALPSLELQKRNLTIELEQKQNYRQYLFQASGLDRLKQVVKELVDQFSQLNGVQKRNYLERLVEKITIKSDNTLELKVFWEPCSPLKCSPVTVRKHFSDSGVNGGSDGTRTHDLRRDRATL